jgi:catechol 2,3-dioxygenase-like lactoylglutathione lyase family enzyme
MPRFPIVMHTALDATDCRELAEFYRAFLGLRYRPGDEPPDDGTADDADWLVLVDESGQRVLAFNQVASLARSTWPTDEVPKQMHLDFRGAGGGLALRPFRRRERAVVRACRSRWSSVLRLGVRRVAEAVRGGVPLRRLSSAWAGEPARRLSSAWAGSPRAAPGDRRGCWMGRGPGCGCPQPRACVSPRRRVLFERIAGILG